MIKTIFIILTLAGVPNDEAKFFINPDHITAFGIEQTTEGGKCLVVMDDGNQFDVTETCEEVASMIRNSK